MPNSEWPTLQRLLQTSDRSCSVSVFASLACISEQEVEVDLPGAAHGEVSVEQWEQWLSSRGLRTQRLEGCPLEYVPCAHLVANFPQNLRDFHWVYRDENGDVHDPSPTTLTLGANHPHMRQLKSYDTHQLTIAIIKESLGPTKPRVESHTTVQIS